MEMFYHIVFVDIRGVLNIVHLLEQGFKAIAVKALQ
jgi:hypothetical protein